MPYASDFREPKEAFCGRITRLGGSLRSVVKHQKLVSLQGEFSVRLTLVVRELHFVGAVEKLHNGAHLAAQKTFRWHFRQKGHDVQ